MAKLWPSRRRGRHEEGEPEHAADVEKTTFGANTYPRFDSGGRPIVEFAPSVRTSLGLDTGVSASFGWVYRQQAAVRLCVDFLADNIAHCRIKVYRRQPDGSRQEVPDHPLAVLLRNPSGRVSGYEFIRDTVADLAIYGNGHWVRRDAGDRRAPRRALVRVSPIFVTNKGGSPVAGPTSYEVDVGGGPVPVTPDFMCHFRKYNPEDVRVGTSVLESLQTIIAEERFASRHRANFWRNAARFEGWIKRPKAAGRWSREQRAEFRDDWKAAMSGSDNAGVTAILEDDMELKEGSFSPRDSEFIAGREWGLDMVATAYHIPLALLSRKGTSTFASMKEFHIIEYVDTLGPWMAEIEKAINVQVVPWYEDPALFVEFNIEEKLQGDFESTAEAMRRAIHVPYMSVNEGRRMRNMPPVDDPDFDQPAKLSTYSYATQPAPPTVVRTAAMDGDIEDLEADLARAAAKESTNGHH